MFAELFERRRFQPVNVQPGTESKLPVCPNYSLIEVCAKFAGIEADTLATDPQFCGQKVTHEDSIAALAGHRGENYIPSMVCKKIRDKLTDRMYWATKEITPPDENLLEAMMKKEGAVVKSNTLFDESLQKIEEYHYKQKILGEWRQAVYETTCIPPELHPPGEPHFQPRAFNELTDEEVIGRVAKFLKSLEDNVVGISVVDGYISLDLSAPYCPQTPKSGHDGVMSLT